MRGDLVLRRIGGALVTLLLASMIASMIVFALVRFAPGDPVDMALGLVSNDLGVNTEMLEERKAELRELHGLNDSVPVQYLRWLKRLAALDLGRSMRTGRPVLRELLGLIPATLLLSSAALLVESALGLSLGLYSAIKAGRFQDGLVRMMCVVMASLPAFVFSLVLLFVFSIRLRWYGISSYAGLSRLWLPALVLGIAGAPPIVRMVRAAMLSELGKLYVAASQSRGLPRSLILRGTFLNALLPVITTLALSFAHLIGGSVVIESIFNWPGLGNYAMNSVLLHDYPAVQGYTVLTVAAVVMINLLVEVAYIVADPRVRKSGREAGLSGKRRNDV